MSEISTTLSPAERVLLPDAPNACGSKPYMARGYGRGPTAALLNCAAGFDVAIDICGDLAAGADEWKAFEQSADCTPFQTFAWLDQWQRHVGKCRGTIPVVVFGRDAQGELLFIIPLAIERSRGLRCLTWLGLDLADYDAPLLAGGFAAHPAAAEFAAVWKSIVALLCSDPRFRFDLVDLSKMPEFVGNQKNPLLQLGALPNRSGAYVATLGPNWDAYYNAKRSASTRKTIRRKQKQLEEHGKIRFVEPADSGACADTVATLIDQKTRSFARMGVENIFQRPGYRDFYLSLVTEPSARGLVHVSRLDVGETIAATNVGLQFRGCYYLILSSYHGGEISRFGPGRTHLHELLHRAIEQGFRYFDFTIGDEPYKLDWADKKLVLYDHLAAQTARGWVIASAVMFARKGKRVIKQTPLLWHLAVKIRALAARLTRRPAAPADDAE